ncbi:hypothetical protein SpiGrapes_2483 [Sphaerochaeta pleomorpha str. Grapes]|uniref:Ig-like domain-containing protein n=1 Tax=Sphaerochaeta pleomorpha (strain ATCC BAA-1885 / DSM 22778 / Grapes) TaxID=158190 RepID=G8QTZ7_SPHPG|nr:hypothetical protein [Sphaerochaeta pleomorpha]AEV30244.1 hypothetical protein SpiGrapes_2483 [Sphaerochaeta pleomorpha str. Grapes]
MKKHVSIPSWFAILLLVMASLNLAGCKEDPARSTLRLTLQNVQNPTERSLVPTGIPLEVTKYVVQGTGPQGNTFSMESSNSSLEIEGLLIGNWDLYAIGQNSSDVDLVEGSNSFLLTTEPKNVTVQLNTLKGTGTMTINFQWDMEKISNASIELSVTNQEGVKTAVAPTINNYANGSVTYSAFYPAGSYTVQARLYSGSIAVAGCAEAVRVVGNKITEGTITLDLDKFAEIPSSLTLINKAGTPIECSISGLSSTMIAMQNVTAEIATMNISDNGSLEISWFLDGQQIATGLDCTFVPSSGTHRLDVIATGALLASSGSASFTFQATVGGTPDIPVLMTEVADGTEGLYVAGDTKVAFLPDGKVLLASATHNSLQVCRIVRDTMEVIRSYSTSDDFNTVGITDMLVDPNSYRVAIADATTPGIALYQYDASDATLTKLFYRNNVKYTKSDGSTLTFSDIDMLSLDGSNGTLYCTVPGSTDLPMSNMYASNAEDFQTNSYTYFLFSSLQEFSGMAIAPGNNKAALFSEPDGLLKLCTRDNSNKLIANDKNFSSETNGTPYLSGIRSVAFLNDSNVVCGTGNALNRFTNTSALNWEQADIWLSGQNGIDSMLGIEQLIVNPSRTVLYAICQDSKNIHCFAVDSSTSELSYLGAASLGIFQPSGAALSPDREFLIVFSKTANKILLFRIPQ